jgi:DNA-binding HxlR family transcriptional regulator
MPDKFDEKMHCPVTVTQNVLMGKWKLAMLWILGQKTRRFSELQRLMPKVSRGVLTQQLRELERDGLIHREVYKEVPPKVEYSLTDVGRSFIPVMEQIMAWGVGYIKETQSCNMDICISNKFSCFKCYEMVRSGEIKLGELG